MTVIWLFGVAAVVIVAIAICALIVSRRADEQSRDQLQSDPGCGADFDGKGHGQ